MFADSEKELPEAEEALHRLLVPENKKRAIQMDEFADLYNPQLIERDKAYVENREKQFAAGDRQDSQKKFGELFEAIINYQIENSELMGPNARVIVPSRFDDIANGIDSIVQFRGPKGATSHLALAIDVTGSEMEIEKKFGRIKSDIENGHLSVAKYFKTKNFRGELRPVARVIVGADHETTADISDLILRFERMKTTIAENRKKGNTSESAQATTKEFSEIRRKLADHPLHQIVLTEIKQQLESFYEYAQSLGKESVADQYRRILGIITEVIDEKGEPQKKLPKHPDDQDKVFRFIMDSAKSFDEQGVV